MLSQITVIGGVPAFVNVVIDGDLLTAVAGLHPNFDAIVAKIEADPEDESVVDLFDIQRAVSTRFEQLSERVAVRDGSVFFDGDEVDGELVNQIVRFLNEGVDDWKPLVAFMENVAQNPSPQSVEQLYKWVQNGDFTITSEGHVVCYKGVTAERTSTRSAPAKDQVTVNGEPIVNKPVPNPDGAVVEMPRSVVDQNPNHHCSVGLHVGNDRYARSFTGNVLEVHVNPRDFVSVTTDSSREKIRCCRYKVVGVVEQRYDQAYLNTNPEPVEAKDVTKAEVVDDVIRVGDRVKTVDHVYGAGGEVSLGELATVTGTSRNSAGDYVAVTWDNPALTANEWRRDRFEKVSGGVTDTRLNYTKQKRYPRGHAQAGQFIPRDSADYSRF